MMDSSIRQKRYGDKVVIKRYQNRKLYDCNQGCYVTLDELYSIFQVYGTDVVVINNSTKTDITAHTMRQVLINKGNQNPLDKKDVEFMLETIQCGGAI